KDVRPAHRYLAGSSSGRLISRARAKDKPTTGGNPMIERRTILTGLGGLALSLAVAGSALAQSYPNRPVQMIVPWAAGGGTDTVARILAAGLEKELGQPVNVVNRTGGNGMTGHSAIATATPDGYTV